MVRENRLGRSPCNVVTKLLLDMLRRRSVVTPLRSCPGCTCMSTPKPLATSSVQERLPPAGDVENGS